MLKEKAFSEDLTARIREASEREGAEDGGLTSGILSFVLPAVLYALDESRARPLSSRSRIVHPVSQIDDYPPR
ncbi:hypothetical protein EAG_04708 [Camponotus floridanus]|uniref:Uncharacterized protein n=1 Tax=Camponotus floridanus TaxID=104421 RepID=E2AIP7_CAMFO|nr:hypothetical protein EAG_04708 [Camponotus floridanus]